MPCLLAQLYRIAINLSTPSSKNHKDFTFSDLRTVNPSDIAIVAQIHGKVNFFDILCGFALWRF